MYTFRKQPFEEITKGFDLTGKLPTGVTISSATVSAVNDATGFDATSTVLGSTTATIESNIKMKVKCIAGDNGVDYKITFKGILNNGEKIEEDMLMEVRDL